MKNTIRELMQSGTTPEELRAVIDKFEAEMAETAALAKEQEIEEARLALMDALAKYYIATGILTEEEAQKVDWTRMMSMFKGFEQNLLKSITKLREMPKVIKVNVSEAPKEGRNLTFEDWLEEIENMFK
jgi:hypothetical protein